MGTFWLNLWLTDWVDYCYHHHHLLLIPGFLSPLERRKLTAKQKVWKQKCNNLINPLLHNSTLQSMHPLPFSFWEKKESKRDWIKKFLGISLSHSRALLLSFFEFFKEEKVYLIFIILWSSPPPPSSSAEKKNNFWRKKYLLPPHSSHCFLKTSVSASGRRAEKTKKKQGDDLDLSLARELN